MTHAMIPRAARRAMLERLWAEGLATTEIARQMGWKQTSPPSTYIAVYRRAGWNLPPRDPARSQAIKEAQWGT